MAFKYSVISTGDGRKEFTVALTRWRDVAEHLADFCNEAIAKGHNVFKVIEHPEADLLYRGKGKTQEDTGSTEADHTEMI